MDADYYDGEALEVRLDAAEKMLVAEQDREQSFNVRAIALAASSLVLLGLLGRSIQTGLSSGAGFREHLLDVAAAGVVGGGAASLGVLIFGVLRPTGRLAVDLAEFERWTSDEGMNDHEAAARYSLLAGTREAIISRAAVNERKADWLGVAYRLQGLTLLCAAVLLTTLAT